MESAVWQLAVTLPDRIALTSAVDTPLLPALKPYRDINTKEKVCQLNPCLFGYKYF